MMKTSTMLSVILAVQLLLAAGIGWGRYQAGDDVQPRPLLDFEISSVDRIEIHDATNASILTKSGGDWVLPEMHDLAANQNRVSRLLDTLSGLETGWPVATTSGSIERLEVDEDNYQRRLRLMAGNQVLGEYYFGTSPGLRQTHGRRAGEDEVFALAINNVDMPGDGNDWLDKTLLGLDAITSISGVDFFLSKGTEAIAGLEEQEEQEEQAEDTWRLDPLESDERSLDPDKTADLVSALERLRVLRVADALPENDPVTVTVGNQERNWIYSFYQGEDEYYLKRDDMDAAFTISKSSFDSIAGVTREDLLMQAPDTGEASGEEVEDEAAA